MKKILWVLLALIIATPQIVNAQKGEACIGVQTGYSGKNKSAIGGVFFQYGITENLRISPEVGGIFRHNDIDAFTLDLNVHFPIDLGLQTTQIYPLAGLNYTQWALHNHVGEKTTLFDKKIGLNLGAGVQIAASQFWLVKIEAKYVITSHYSGTIIDIGLGYRF